MVPNLLGSFMEDWIGRMRPIAFKGENRGADGEGEVLRVEQLHSLINAAC